MKDTNLALAEDSGVGFVRMCECGSINLNAGVVTLYLDPETFRRSTALLQRAAGQYLERSRSASATPDLHRAFPSPSSRFTN
jgi:hypothetical protein